MADKNRSLDHTLSLSRIHGNYVYYWDFLEAQVTKKHVDYPEIRVIGFAGSAREAHKMILEDYATM